MKTYEAQFMDLVAKIILNGEHKEGRNGGTYSVFGEQLKVDLRDGFPLLHGRQLYYKGVLGELAAMLRRPQHRDDFEAWGCNYWEKWCDADGSIRVDYGNAWFDFNGVDQIAMLKQALANNPNDRRMLINAWRPDHLPLLNLPCCHYCYQFYVGADNTIHMVWIQRSVDTMIGLPSDVIFAAAWLEAIANEFGFEAGTITFQLGDTHIYEEHLEGARQYLKYAKPYRDDHGPQFSYLGQPGADFCTFIPDNVVVYDYRPAAKINFELKA